MFLLIDNKKIIETRVASGEFERMKGLMGKKNIDFGLLFNHCNNIHTFFMKEPIDVIYIDKNGIIVALDNPIVPWRLGRLIFKGKHLVELPEGTINKFDIKIGQKVTFLEE